VIIATRLLFSDATFVMKQKRIIGVTKSFPRRMKACSSICAKPISSIEIVLLPNATVGISMRWLRQQRKRRRCCANFKALLSLKWNRMREREAGDGLRFDYALSCSEARRQQQLVALLEPDVALAIPVDQRVG
jgi:hypothetical protein